VRVIVPHLTGNILDFGCGSKPFADLFKNANHYIGVDILVSGHDHVDSKVDVFYDGSHLPFADASFDHIVSFEVLEHVFNLEEVLAELMRVLKPGGMLLFSIPFAWDEHERPYDFGRYTTFGIKYKIRQRGFIEIDAQPTNTFLEAVSQLFILYLYYIARSKFKIINQLFQLIVIFPISLISVLICRLLPRYDTLFSGLVVTAHKPKTDA